MFGHALDIDHQDHAEILPIVKAIIKASGGWDGFLTHIPPLFRLAIDEVIDAPRSGRLLLEEIEKTEKTYLGTKIEIVLRDFFRFPKGEVLDFEIDGVECDVKHTMGKTWSIPIENIGRPAILLRENEATARCDFGVIVIRPEYMNAGRNRDSKGSISSKNLNKVWWLLKDHPYPENIWQMMDAPVRQAIIAAGQGTKRIATLFELFQEKPIPRSAIEAMGKQRDPLKRIRRNGGARDILAPKGIAVLFGKYDKELIEFLGLPKLGPEEFVSFTARTEEQRSVLRSQRHID